MILGIGLLAWHYAAWHSKEPHLTPPATDPLAGITVTPSMRATAKYFWVVLALVLTQILLGAITAHYQVEGQQFYGFDISKILPYSLTRSWHTELAVLWIATAWLATGLYIGPAVSGHEPKYQRLGVNILWVCLLIIVVGAFTGQWFAVMQKMGLANNFWFGHQGWEYVDLGRFWQIFLFVGLLLWLVLVGRSLWPALRRKDEMSSIVGLLFLSTVAIALFYGAGLMWGEHTHISMVEYWRWWVVHLWVEGFFEVFAVAVISFLFVKLGPRAWSDGDRQRVVCDDHLHGRWCARNLPSPLLRRHHGRRDCARCSFSALEVVPLALIGMEAYETWSHGRATPWMQAYRWPIMFFLAVSFWIWLVRFVRIPHQHAACAVLHAGPQPDRVAWSHGLVRVYGMLGLGLMLFCMRGMKPDVQWNEGWLRGSFWALNIGLSLMAILTLLPLGVLQLSAVLENGYWYARSAEFMTQPIIHLLVWMRVPGDTISPLACSCSPVRRATVDQATAQDRPTRQQRCAAQSVLVSRDE